MKRKNWRIHLTHGIQCMRFFLNIQLMHNIFIIFDMLWYQNGNKIVYCSIHTLHFHTMKQQKRHEINNFLNWSMWRFICLKFWETFTAIWNTNSKCDFGKVKINYHKPFKGFALTVLAHFWRQITHSSIFLSLFVLRLHPRAHYLSLRISLANIRIESEQKATYTHSIKTHYAYLLCQKSA